MEESRAQHLQWCKDRALEYIDIGEYAQAWDSMCSDLGKHPETKGHSAMQLGMALLMGGQLSTPEKMREFILGFH
jgi:hypothetical protein